MMAIAKMVCCTIFDNYSVHLTNPIVRTQFKPKSKFRQKIKTSQHWFPWGTKTFNFVTCYLKYMQLIQYITCFVLFIFE